MVEPISKQIEQGTLVYDASANKVGEYRGKAGPYAMLRPVGGGREWEANPGSVRPATPEERLSANVKAANSRSGEGNSVPYDISTPPSPIPDCPSCADLAALRHDARARARNDGTAETDANVLLRRHQHRDHDIRHRRISRFIPFAITQDPGMEPEYEAHCVSCAATSGPCPDPTTVEKWQHSHTQETRHTRYRRSFADYAVLEAQVQG
ncbi:hypothetical protein [Streptomyces sp. STR69]|uniref:DUF7848 domain-containing protein n=1 Tax=Streptomyces sp. STR69 TaxID=1796942 RepID=UPI002905DE0E|nr:hypothetical protein [Streptomyces sp. STR69]